MFTEKKSIRYFLFGCIPARLLLVFIPLYIAKHWLFYYGILLLVIGISFLYLFFTNSRLGAFEAGGKTWWANYRIIHGLLYSFAAILAMQKNRYASMPLFIDVMIGFFLFMKQHYIQ